jgi:hydroxypyruvate isomerase
MGDNVPRFAANLHYLFNEVPFLERFEAAARVGFHGVEFQVPYHWPASQLTDLLNKNHLELVLMDTRQGDWDAGERGLAALPGREEEFRSGVLQAAEYASTMGSKTVHLIAGVVPSDTDPEKVRGRISLTSRSGPRNSESMGLSRSSSRSIRYTMS